MASTVSVKRTGPFVQKRIDNQTQSYPPLDYSFHNAQKLEGRMMFFFPNYFVCMCINRCPY
jgi:hypothetical protein